MIMKNKQTILSKALYIITIFFKRGYVFFNHLYMEEWARIVIKRKKVFKDSPPLLHNKY